MLPEAFVSVRLYVSPAASGKTTYALNLVREAAHQLQSIPRVIVPTHVQARSWRQQLAEAGRAIGIRVMAFDQGSSPEAWRIVTDVW